MPSLSGLSPFVPLAVPTVIAWRSHVSLWTAFADLKERVNEQLRWVTAGVQRIQGAESALGGTPCQ